MLSGQPAVSIFKHGYQAGTEQRIRFELKPEEVHLWTATPLPPLLPAMFEILSEEETEGAGRFRFEEHRSFYIFARSWLRIILSYYLGRQPKDLVFDRGPWGKPFLVEGQNPINILFNVAHSGSLVVIAVAAGRRVGVDVEQVRPFEDLIQVAESCFTTEECASILSRPPHERGRAFFRCWTRKEARLKAEGKGLSGIVEYSGALIPEHQPGRQVPNVPRRASTPWWLADLDLPEGYCGAVAVEGGFGQMLYWNWNSLLGGLSTVSADRITAGPLANNQETS